MYVITYEAVQDDESENYDDTIGGAFISCYFRDLDSISSNKRACEIMKESGWTPIRIESQGSINIYDFSSDDQDFEYISQAESDGECIIFHTWPLEELE